MTDVNKRTRQVVSTKGHDKSCQQKDTTSRANKRTGQVVPTKGQDKSCQQKDTTRVSTKGHNWCQQKTKMGVNKRKRQVSTKGQDGCQQKYMTSVNKRQRRVSTKGNSGCQQKESACSCFTIFTSGQTFNSCRISLLLHVFICQ